MREPYFHLDETSDTYCHEQIEASTTVISQNDVEEAAPSEIAVADELDALVHRFVRARNEEMEVAWAILAVEHDPTYEARYSFCQHLLVGNVMKAAAVINPVLEQLGKLSGHYTRIAGITGMETGA